MNEKINQSITELSQYFITRDLKLSCAESCTGGLLSAAITSQSGVSKYFLGSVISYASAVKHDLLDVPESLIQCVGEVSVPVALHMARGVRKKLNSHWSVSITGIAGPTGGSPDKPVGTVCFAACGPAFERAVQKQFKNTNRQKIQLDSVEFAIDFLMKNIKEGAL